MRKIVLCIFALVISVSASAKTYEMCFKEAAEKHDIPLQWLYAIAFTESSFNPKSRNKNRNGSHDYGFMQINSLWKKEAHRMGYSWQQVTSNPCTNVMFGGHILKNNLKRMKTLEKAIGAYNAGFARTPKARNTRKRYYNEVRKNRQIAQKHLHRLKKKASIV